MLMTKDSKNQQNSPVCPPHTGGGRGGKWGTAGEMVAAFPAGGGCPDSGYIRQDVPAGGGDNLMVLTIYQSLMTASRDAFGEQGKNTVRCRTSYVYWRRLSIALAQHPAPVRLDPLAYKWGIA